MAKRTTPDRRRKVEELKRQQRKAERRRTLMIVGASGFIGLGLIAAVVVPSALNWVKSPDRKSQVREIGVKLADAGCTPVKDFPKPKSAKHVEEGTTVTYDANPPYGGDHWANPASAAPKFVNRRDAVEVERYVHSMEHGYVIVWYTGGATDKDLEDLRAIAKKIGPKFIAVPWPRAPFADGKAIGISAWRHTETCSSVSGEVIQDFYDKFHPPKGDAPEKAVL
ncbi:MAG: DUF3105 domain-containing protein [Mycobacteriales bacterium]|nr:DUF3105 domain-containing protein [Frankia sp.]